MRLSSQPGRRSGLRGCRQGLARRTFSYPGREAAAVPSVEYSFPLTGYVSVVKAPAEIDISGFGDPRTVVVVQAQAGGDGLAR